MGIIYKSHCKGDYFLEIQVRGKGEISSTQSIFFLDCEFFAFFEPIVDLKTTISLGRIPGL